MSIKAEYKDGVFAPLQEVEEPAPGEVYQVFSESELRRLAVRRSVVEGLGAQLRVLGERGGRRLRCPIGRATSFSSPPPSPISLHPRRRPALVLSPDSFNAA